MISWNCLTVYRSGGGNKFDLINLCTTGVSAVQSHLNTLTLFKYGKHIISLLVFAFGKPSNYNLNQMDVKN